MPRKLKELPPIELSCSIQVMPSQIFRALTSQNELRKWWASRVTMSRNRVFQKGNTAVYMKLISSEKDSFVRYSWRPEGWESEYPQSTITFTISDLGASRENTGEGLLLEVIHDGWINEEERAAQEDIWGLALKSLKSLLEHKRPIPWWQGEENDDSWKQIRLQALKQVLETFKKTKGRHQEGKRIYQSLWRICTILDPYGKWYLNEEEDFFLQRQNQKLFEISKGEIVLFWEEFKGIPESHLRHLKERLFVEQDIDLDFSQEQTRLSVAAFQGELWLAWCLDMIKELEHSGQIKQ